MKTPPKESLLHLCSRQKGRLDVHYIYVHMHYYYIILIGEYGPTLLNMSLQMHMPYPTRVHALCFQDSHFIYTIMDIMILQVLLTYAVYGQL